jgi:hypothetical protein
MVVITVPSVALEPIEASAGEGGVDVEVGPERLTGQGEDGIAGGVLNLGVLVANPRPSADMTTMWPGAARYGCRV